MFHGVVTFHRDTAEMPGPGEGQGCWRPRVKHQREGSHTERHFQRLPWGLQLRIYQHIHGTELEAAQKQEREPAGAGVLPAAPAGQASLFPRPGGEYPTMHQLWGQLSKDTAL